MAGLFQAFPLRYLLLQSVLPEWAGRRTEQSFLDFLSSIPRLMAAKKTSDAHNLADGKPTIKGMDPREMPHRLVPHFNKEEAQRAEVPSFVALSSARGLARVASMVAGNGQFRGRRVLPASAVAAMLAEPSDKSDAAIAGLNTRFTQGGVNHYVVEERDSAFRRYAKELREGFYGWQGLGGSICQWHPELKIGEKTHRPLIGYHSTHV